MKKKREHALSLRLQMILLMLVCWLIPVILLLGVMVWYLHQSLDQTEENSLAEQLRIHTQMCAERLDSAVEASRLASYDPTIRSAWNAYQQDGSYAALYRSTQAFLNRQYASDSRFLFSAFWFTEDPERMTLAGISGTLMYNQVKEFWEESFPAARDMAQDLDTGIGFLEKDGQIYLIRNLLDSRYQTVGVLVLSLNLPYYFQELSTLSWASEAAVSLSDAEPFLLMGEELPSGRSVLTSSEDGSGYRLQVEVSLDYGSLLAPYTPYRYVLLAMAVLLLPFLWFTVRFLNGKVSRPVSVMMEGAARIENGSLGYQIEPQTSSREFLYLTDSFNHMSGRLQYQFNRIYQEELALKNAQIKALQSHINPHFLNNTLEIINWEARIDGNEKVSRMIEALSTVLDAALERKRAPEVPLSEEMECVNAYLYIVSERYGKRLRVTIDIPAELLEYRVPRLILQPVIENAVEHGVGDGQGTVVLRGFRDGKYLILETENDGGLSESDRESIARFLSPDYDMSGESSGNIGIANVNQRLRILYGPPCGLAIFQQEDTSLVTARLTIAIPDK